MMFAPLSPACAVESALRNEDHHRGSCGGHGTTNAYIVEYLTQVVKNNDILLTII